MSDSEADESNDSDEDANDDDSETRFEGPPLPDYSTLLPTSLKTLTLLVEDKYIRGKAAKILQDPFLTALGDVCIMNVTKTHWISKTTGEGGMDPRERYRQRQQRSRDKEAARRLDAAGIAPASSGHGLQGREARDRREAAMRDLRKLQEDEEEMFGGNADFKEIAATTKQAFKAIVQTYRDQLRSIGCPPPTPAQEEARLRRSVAELKKKMGSLGGTLEPTLDLYLTECQIMRAVEGLEG